MLEDNTLDTYLSQLASDAPTPGGGAAAALTAAQGSALLAMAVAASHRGALSPQHQVLLDKLQSHRQGFSALAQRDTDAFDGIIQAYQQPRDNDDQKQARRQAIRAALHAALAVSMDSIRAIQDCLTLVSEALDASKDTLVSDVGVGNTLLAAAAPAASYLAYANLAPMRDKAFVAKQREQITTLLRQLSEQAQAHTVRINVRLGIADKIA